MYVFVDTNITVMEREGELLEGICFCRHKHNRDGERGRTPKVYVFVDSRVGKRVFWVPGYSWCSFGVLIGLINHY